MNRLRRDGAAHASERASERPATSVHCVLGGTDCVALLERIPDASVQLIVCDPPYNLKLAQWDERADYVDWAATWLQQCVRVLRPSGNLALFGGLQFQEDASGGDLHSLMHVIRTTLPLRLVNLIIWHYRNGMSAHRFFANRHEEIAWFAKTKRYTFNLDAVRERYTPDVEAVYLRDKRLNPDSVRAGKNPTNVWDIPRLNANAKERVGHPTQKPIALITRLVRALSNPGDVVLDCFGGSGVTAVTAIREGRHSIVADADPQLAAWCARLREHAIDDDALPSAYRIVDRLEDAALA